MSHHVASFGLSFADQSIAWPARGSGGRSLVARDGWSRRSIPVSLRSASAASMGAMCRDPLAVNVMAEGEGFAICLSATGYRISYGGRVFARCVDAMVAAEAMLCADLDWAAVPKSGLTPRQRSSLKAIFEGAEVRGEILLDRIFPS